MFKSCGRTTVEHEIWHMHRFGKHARKSAANVGF